MLPAIAEGGFGVILSILVVLRLAGFDVPFLPFWLNFILESGPFLVEEMSPAQNWKLKYGFWLSRFVSLLCLLLA